MRAKSGQRPALQVLQLDGLGLLGLVGVLGAGVHVEVAVLGGAEHPHEAQQPKAIELTNL